MEIKECFLSEMYQFMFLNERALFNILFELYLPRVLFLTIDSKDKLQVCDLRGNLFFEVPLKLPNYKDYYIEHKGCTLYYCRNNRRNIAINLAAHESKIIDEESGEPPAPFNNPKIEIETINRGLQVVRIKNKENGLVKEIPKFGAAAISSCKDLISVIGLNTSFLNKENLKMVTCLNGYWYSGSSYSIYCQRLDLHFGSDIFMQQEGKTEIPKPVNKSLCLDENSYFKTVVADISKDGNVDFYLHNNILFAVSFE